MRCGVIGDKLTVPYTFRVVWRHWWPAHCTVYIPCGMASLANQLIVPYTFRVVWRHWWPAHCTVYITCGVASLANHITVPYTLRVVWRHWWPAHWTLYLPASSDRWYLFPRLATWTSSPLRECLSANMTPAIIQWRSVRLLQAGRQALYESVIPKLIGSVLVVHWICHHDHRFWVHYITMCGIIWKLCYRHTSCTADRNFSNAFSALQEAIITVKCFVIVQVVWSHGSTTNVAENMVDTLNNLHWQLTTNV